MALLKSVSDPTVSVLDIMSLISTKNSLLLTVCVCLSLLTGGSGGAQQSADSDSVAGQAGRAGAELRS